MEMAMSLFLLCFFLEPKSSKSFWDEYMSVLFWLLKNNNHSHMSGFSALQNTEYKLPRAGLYSAFLYVQNQNHMGASACLFFSGCSKDCGGFIMSGFSALSLVKINILHRNNIDRSNVWFFWVFKDVVNCIMDWFLFFSSLNSKLKPLLFSAMSVLL